jgi:alanine dehydrogenase
MKKETARSTLILSRKQIEEILPLKAVIRAVEDSYRELGLDTATVPPRIRIDIERYNANILVMPAYLAGLDALGTKLVTTHLENSKLNLPTVIGTIVLNDPRTGAPIAILDGTYITAMRTGAAGVIAAKYLSRDDSSTITVVGTGV